MPTSGVKPVSIATELAELRMRMTPAESIVASTMNGACAVRRQDRLGSIEAGKQADIAVYYVPDYREIPYFAAVNFCVAAFKRGEIVWERK